MKVTTAHNRAGHGHRHTNGHEHDFEPVHGLPEMLPAGERILWQGAPDWRALAVQAFHVRKLAVYFGGLLLLQVAVTLNQGGGAGAVVQALVWPVVLALLALGSLGLLAWLSARTTAYTITNKRVVMRVGIVLTLAFNLPFARIAAAGLHQNAPKRGAGSPPGTGDIALTLAGADRIAWLNLWPHARPWHLAKPQPTLRCVPEVDTVAQLLACSWAEATGRPLQAQPAPADMGSEAHGGDALHGQPALSAR